MTINKSSLSGDQLSSIDSIMLSRNMITHVEATRAVKRDALIIIDHTPTGSTIVLSFLSFYRVFEDVIIKAVATTKAANPKPHTFVASHIASCFFPCS